LLEAILRRWVRMYNIMNKQIPRVTQHEARSVGINRVLGNFCLKRGLNRKILNSRNAYRCRAMILSCFSWL
jgi:hypothetical protein